MPLKAIRATTIATPIVVSVITLGRVINRRSKELITKIKLKK